MLFSLLALTSLVIASPVKRQLAQVIRSCTVPNRVALTFDDGPWQYIYDISNTLNAAGAKGTFFFNGNNYACIYSDESMNRVRYAYNAGHQVASHTWSHSHLSSLTWDQVHDEMWRVELALMRIVGVQPAFMRPPYGEYNDNVLAASYVRGQKVVLWDLDSGDSIGATAAESQQLYRSTIAQHPSTILTLNHETRATTAYEVLPYAIAQLQNAGYELVTVAECLGEEPYQFTQAPGTPDSSWVC